MNTFNRWFIIIGIVVCGLAIFFTLVGAVISAFIWAIKIMTMIAVAAAVIGIFVSLRRHYCGERKNG